MKKFTILSILLCVSSTIFGMEIYQGDDVYKLEQKKLTRQWISKIVRMRMNNENFKEVYGSDENNILMDAVQNAECSVIRQILNLRDNHRNPVVDINFRNKNGDTALLMAVRGGDIEKIRVLLANGADICVKNNKGDSVLSLIIESGTIKDNYEKFKLLFKYDVSLDLLNSLEGLISKKKLKGIRNKLENIRTDVNYDRKYMKFLMLIDSPGFMNYLTKYWKEVNAPVTDNGDTVLCFAVMCASKNLVLNLIENRSKLDLNLNLGNNKGMNPLLIAASRDYKDIVNCLIENGANLDITNIDGNSALLISSYTNHKEIVSSLVKNGANLDIQNKQGRSSLIMAICEDHKDIANFLVKSGANLDLQDMDGDTALTVATYSYRKEIADSLIDGGANLNIQNKQGMSPLMNALFMDYPIIATNLIEKGANLNLQSTYGLNALMFSLFNVTLSAKLEKAKGWKLTEKFLLIEKYENRLINLVDKGADLNLCDNFGNTVLLYTLLMECKKSANYLIDKGADFNITNNRGITALMAAVGSGDIDIVKKLMDKGADPKHYSICDYTALSIAVEKGYSSIVKELLSRLDKVSIKRKDKTKRTALHMAIDKGYKDIVKLLLDKYESISATEIIERDKLKMSIWELAKKREDIGIMEMLLRYLNDENLKEKLKKEVDDKKDRASKAERKAIKTYGKVSTVQNQKLLKNTEYADAVNKAFIDYALKGVIPDMEMLLNGDTKVTMDSVYQALRTAAKTNNCKVIDSILMKVSGLNINDKDKESGNTALMIAAEKGNYEVVSDLVANGAFVSSENNLGETALLLAARNGHIKVIRYLCTVGVKQRDKNSVLNYIDTEILNKKKDWGHSENENFDKLKYEEIKEYLSNKVIEDKDAMERLGDSDICGDRLVYFNSHSKKDWETWRNKGDFFERIQYLIQEIKKDPYKRGATLGKVEALTGRFEGLFSRRINDEHRLVYRVIDHDIYIVSCGGHYYKLRTTKDLFKDISSCFNKVWENRELIDI